MRLEYFQMIDAIVDFQSDDGRLVALSRIPNESPIFEGHFPGYPLMPGVLLIETMAQASGYLVLALNRFSQMPFLAGVRDAKLRSFVSPKTPISVEAHLEYEGSGYARTEALVRHEDKKICDAGLTFKTMPFPAPELEQAMRQQAAQLGLPLDLVHQ